jgi:hypothetical protein
LEHATGTGFSLRSPLRSDPERARKSVRLIAFSSEVNPGSRQETALTQRPKSIFAIQENAKMI